MEVSRRNLFKGMTVSALMMSAPAFAQLEAPQKWDAEYDIVIVGGGAAGLSAATVAAMKSSQRSYLKSRVSSVVPLYLTAECLLLQGQRSRKNRASKILRNCFSKT